MAIIRRYQIGCFTFDIQLDPFQKPNQQSAFHVTMNVRDDNQSINFTRKSAITLSDLQRIGTIIHQSINDIGLLDETES
jgi:hypothetical protein